MNNIHLVTHVTREHIIIQFNLDFLQPFESQKVVPKAFLLGYNEKFIICIYSKIYKLMAGVYTTSCLKYSSKQHPVVLAVNLYIFFIAN